MPNIDIRTTLASPTWWFTVVVAGAVVSVLGAYCKAGIDRALSSVSTRWRRRTENAAALGQRCVELLASDTVCREMYQQRVLRARFFAIALGVSSLTFFALAILGFQLNDLHLAQLSGFCGAICSLYSLLRLIKTTDADDMLREAYRRLLSKQEPGQQAEALQTLLK